MARDDDSAKAGPVWHERTPAVMGASAAALAVIAVLVLAASCVSQTFNDPAPVPQYFLGPSASSSDTSTSITETVTSTSPPVTTDIGPGDTSTTSGTETTTTTTTRRTTDDDETTSQRRPRFNETRTLYPRP